MSTNKKHLVVFTGAGISAESGLLTFRDTDGLWEGYSVEEVATPRGFQKNPQLVLDFYNMRRKQAAAANPNKAHLVLASLEEFFDVSIITQNVDDLHERAGSSKVIHLHGELTKMRSVYNTEQTYPYENDIRVGDKAPDGGQLRPFIVWFEEEVPMMEIAAKIALKAALFVVIGTSLQVYPAAGLVRMVNPTIPKFILDKHIPDIQGVRNITPIESSAVNGIEILYDYLLMHSN